MFSVTIPQKELVVDFPIDVVKTAVSKLPKMLDTCTLLQQDDVIKKYDLQFTSFASAGNKLSVHLVEINENKTKIVTDTTRIIGTYNQSHEVTAANNDYNKMTQALSKLLTNPNINETEMNTYSNSNSNSGVNFILYIIMIILMIYIFTR